MATYDLVEINDGHYLKLLKVLNDCNNNNGETSSLQGNEQSPKRGMKIVIIPGNPGLVEFYEQFACELNEMTQCPVICVSHTGHIYDRSGSLSSWEPADLEEQIDDKIKFIEKHLFAGDEEANDFDVVFIGHSIGCHVILQLLDRLEPKIKKHVKKAILLFPTVERMAETPNGKILTFLTSNTLFVRALYFLVFLVTCLPAFIRKPLIDLFYMKKNNAIKNMELCDNMAAVLFQMTKTFSCARSILHMGKDEMHKVTNLSKKIVCDNAHLLLFYYGTRDRWCPIDYYFDMLDMVSKNITGIEAKKPEILLDKLNLSHGFVVHKRQCSTVAKLTADWIKSI